jgi:hypothetical protein
MEMESSRDLSLIGYRCQRRDHQHDAAGPSRVFIHRGAWAYCEAGKLAPGHEFLATGGLTRRHLEGRATGGGWAGRKVRSTPPETEGSRS